MGESLLQELRQRARELAGVEETLTRFGKRDRPAWTVAGKEFAHLHADDVIDLRLPAASQRRLRDDRRVVSRKGRSSWMEFRIESAADVADAVALMDEAARAVDGRKGADGEAGA